MYPFIVFKISDFAHWLSDFCKPIEQWHSLLLWKPVDNEARLTIQQGHATLIDVRNYLFSRLCHLLFRIGKLGEVVNRLHYFLHSIATEIEILEVSTHFYFLYINNIYI